jgi:uncharacterized protein (DUF2384 family)
MKKTSAEFDPDETGDLRSLAHEVVRDADQWMDAPNDQLGGKKPNDLVGTASESVLRDLLRSIKHGMPT